MSEGWKWDVLSKTLTLSGVNIRSKDDEKSSVTAYGIRLPEGATIELTQDTDNTVVAGNRLKGDSIAVDSAGELTITGAGSFVLVEQF